MNPDYRSFVQAQEKSLKEAIIELVNIPSVCKENEDGLPFGRAVDDALRKVLEISARLGFRTHYGDGGYYGYAETGTGPEMLAVLCHVDVVPPGDLKLWETPPFQGVERDGYLYGRGVWDDKGPTLATMFAVKALMDAGVNFQKRVRFIFSTDEETLWRCMKRYAAQEELPTLGLVPDTYFPVEFAEKGDLQVYLEGENESNLRFTCGEVFNSVPGVARYDGPRQEELRRRLDELGFAYRLEGDSTVALGKAAHVMEAEVGVNAIGRLALGLEAAGVHSKALDFIAQKVGVDPYARRLFGECEDKPSGKLKFNIGRLEMDHVERVWIDMRLPVTVEKEAMLARLSDTAADYGLSAWVHDWQEPLYLPLDHPVIQTLLEVYQYCTGDTTTPPFASGGATLARTLPNCVAFGAQFWNTPVTAHHPNEGLLLKDIYLAMYIYAQAIYVLTR